MENKTETLEHPAYSMYHERLIYLELENSKLKKAVADLTAEVSVLKERVLTLERSAGASFTPSDQQHLYCSPSEEQGTCPEPLESDPAHITYLLSPHLCDWYFVVGNPEQGQPERVGVVKKMLLAHCEVLRSPLVDYGKDMHLVDTRPDTFKHLLRFVYGHDMTADLSFEEADDLLYLAEQYLVRPLTTRLSVRLANLLHRYNIHSLLNNPTCYSDPTLNSAITRMMQRSRYILSPPGLLDLSVDGMVRIVEQEVLNVWELDVWRNVVRWAQHYAGSDSVEAVREVMARPARHIRLCTIDQDTLRREVLPTGLLTDEEATLVCQGSATGEVQTGLVTFSNRVDRRKSPDSVQPTCLSLDFDKHVDPFSLDNLCIIHIETQKWTLELWSLTFKGIDLESWEYRFADECCGTVTIFHPPEAPVTVEIYLGPGDHDYPVALTTSGEPLVMEPYSTYVLVVSLSDEVVMWVSREFHKYSNEHMAVWSWCETDWHYLPFWNLQYLPLHQGHCCSSPGDNHERCSQPSLVEAEDPSTSAAS